MNTLKITLNEDGTVSVNATQMKGRDAAILAELQDLAKSLGGDLKVEKHVGHHHHHHEGRDHVHE